MRRGDLITVAAPGDFGKPRPAVVVQSDLFGELASVTVCLLSSDLRDAPLLRIAVDPSPVNGLDRLSQIQVDKVVTVAHGRVGRVIGHLEAPTLARLSSSLALFLGIA